MPGLSYLEVSRQLTRVGAERAQGIGREAEQTLSHQSKTVTVGGVLGLVNSTEQGARSRTVVGQYSHIMIGQGPIGAYRTYTCLKNITMFGLAGGVQRVRPIVQSLP
jgi:hypothetical protein